MDDETDLNEAEKPTDAEESESGRSVSSDLIRGHINTIILRALYEGDKYGYEIIADIENKSHGQYSLKQPSLYSALKRLEKDGCVTSYWGGSVSGGRRKYFSLTDLGKEISEKNQSEWEYSRTIIDSLISEKDFDFNNPAPNMVNMRILRDTTSRITHEDGEEEEEGVVRMGGAEADEELAKRKEELEKREAALEERREALLREQEWREEELARRESLISAAKEALARQETDDGEKQRLELVISENRNEIALLNHLNETLKEELAQQGRQNEDVRLRIIEEERKRAEEEVARANARAEETDARAEEAIEAERARFQAALDAERSRISAEESRRAQEYVLAETERIRREQEEIYLKREQELIRQNYRDLMNSTAPAPTEKQETIEEPAPAAPVAEELPPPAYEPAPPPRPVVFETAELPEDDLPVAPQRTGVDFSEIEQRAIRDGIRVVTTGTKSRQQLNEENSVRLVHKGKCLFMSSIVACLFCVVLGSILLGIRKDLAIPAFYPYVIWCVGIALLLAMGLAYANRYGERAIRRRATIVLINVAVIYALLVIVTLIIALSARIDFSSAAACATFIYIPIVFELIVPIFGVVYYFLIRAKNEK